MGDPRDMFSFNPVGAHLQDATISAATTLTPPIGATKLLIQGLTKDVRYTLDGTVPTASKGFVIMADDPPMLIPLGNEMVIKVIEEEASASIEYQWGSG